MEPRTRANGGSPGRRVLAAYLTLVMLVAMVGPGISVYAAEGDVTDAQPPVLVPVEESEPSVEVPAAEEAVALEAPAEEPVAESPGVVEAKSSVPTPQVFPAAVPVASVDPVLSPDPSPPLTAGGVRFGSPSTGVYTASSPAVDAIVEPVPDDFELTLQVFETSTGAYVSFSSDYRITKVVMKGGPGGSNIYAYSPGTFADSFLHAPAGTNGKWSSVCRVDVYFAAVPTTGCISAYKFRDDNRNQIWDEGEPALADWEMTLRDDEGTIVGTQSTDSEGLAWFSRVDPGEYTVTETLQSGWDNTTPLTRSAEVVAGARTCVYFGNVPVQAPKTGDLVVYKFLDASDDGEYDDGELMLAGWDFTLHDAAHNVVATGKTGVDGSIMFKDLAPGVYHATETLLGGWRNTTLLTQYITVEAGDCDQLWFGNIRVPAEPETGGLIVHKFRDDNENQVRDEGEPMLENWHFTLTHETPPLEARALPSAIELVDEGDTDADGEVLFTELTPGLIYVTETLQSGWANTTPLKQSATIVAGETKELWFGNVPETPQTGSLVIHKFEDVNENQVRDTGEPMLEDWEFTVVNPAGPTEASVNASVALIGSGTTNAAGELIFNNLDPMTVEVTETLQDGWENTTPLTQTAQIVAGRTTHVWFGNVQFLQFTELDLAIQKSVDDRTVDEGQLLTYTLTYWNLMSEEDALNYTIVDDYDERYLTIVNANGGVVSGGKITWTFAGPLSQAMGKQTLTYTARVIADMPDRTTNIDNVVVIDDDRDFNPSNNRDDERVVYDPDDPFLPFTGGEYLLLVLVAVAASVVGLVLRLKPRAS